MASNVNLDEAQVGIPVPIEETEVDILNISDPAELRQMYIELGGNPGNKTFLEAERRAHEATDRRFDAEAKANPYASASRKTAEAFLNVAILFVQTVFQYAVPVAFLGLLVAEGIAAYKGFESIMESLPAIIYSGVIMLVSTVAMFLKESLLQNATKTEVSYKPTIGIIAERIKYLFGFRGLVARENSAALDMTNRALNLAVWLLVIVGILGRFSQNAELSSSGVPWPTAIQRIILESNLSTIMEYVSSMLLPYAMYVCLHVLVYFIYRSYLLSTGGVDITSDQAFDFLSPPSREAILRVEMATAYRDMVMLQRSQVRKKLQSKLTTTALPPPSQESLVT